MSNISTVGEHCFGCTACQHICPVSCIRMEEDSKGFLYPQVDESMCTNCEKCRQVCPYVMGYQDAELFPEVRAYAVKHKNDHVRLNSTSGGAFTALSDTVLQKGGTVYGAGYDDDMRVCHLRTDTKNKRDTLRGSKYVQSNLGNVFKDIEIDISKGILTLFVGNPCQVAGLRNYLPNRDNLILVDHICYGVPSPKIFRDYLLHISNNKPEEIKDFFFRDKKHGWGKTTLTLTKKDGSKRSNLFKYKSFMSLFHGLSIRPNCYECPFTSYNRPSDITIADFWGVEKSYPEFYDNTGVSLVLVNSMKGVQVFNELVEDITYIESTLDGCFQSHLQMPTQPKPYVAQFWSDYERSGYSYVARKYGGENLASRLKGVILKVFGRTPILAGYRRLM